MMKLEKLKWNRIVILLSMPLNQHWIIDIFKSNQQIVTRNLLCKNERLKFVLIFLLYIIVFDYQHLIFLWFLKLERTTK